MSCSNDNCVCHVVREIAEVQEEVANNNSGCCTTSCERSIQQMLAPVTNNNGNGYTTIPFMLTCKGDCEQYIATGIYKDTNGSTTFECVESPVLRVKEFVNDGDCCARVEILQPVNASGNPVATEGDEVCDFFPAANFLATGICITLDLNCFCAITCLDPITPIPSSQFPA